MVSVAIGIGEDDDFVVSEVIEVTIFAECASECVCDIAKFFILLNFSASGGLCVLDFSAQREDGLNSSVASLFCGTAGGIAFDEEEFAFGGVIGGAFGEFSGEIEFSGGFGGLCDVESGLMRGLTCSCGEDDFIGDSLSGFGV